MPVFVSEQLCHFLTNCERPDATATDKLKAKQEAESVSAAHCGGGRLLHRRFTAGDTHSSPVPNQRRACEMPSERSHSDDYPVISVKLRRTQKTDFTKIQDKKDGWWSLIVVTQPTKRKGEKVGNKKDNTIKLLFFFFTMICDSLKTHLQD